MATNRDWTELEVEAIVSDYFAMLEKELRGVPYNKSEHRRALRPLLRDRSEGSIEMKHQNISAILIEAGHPYIRGYKPASQYQGLLSDVVLDRLDGDAALHHLAVEFAEAVVQPPRIDNVLNMMTRPPDLLESARLALAAQKRRRQARTIDYLARESRNRAIGLGGEALVVRYERARLSSLGCDALAQRVQHVAATQGDGLGYDVHSFATNGRDRFIEVKTTQLGPMTPFYITESEISFSSENHENYSLYRVYDFASRPLMFSLDGRVEGSCTLRATVHGASAVNASSAELMSCDA
ncbi:MAG: hypothetical protein QOC81_5115 [Thermoanaerobaculia bacterium]|nr:hypothetical protein [Thermoanaerobaculia bacterium]